MLGLGVASAFWCILDDWYPFIFFSSSILPLAAVNDFIGVFKGDGALVCFRGGGGLELLLEERRDE